MTVFRAATLRTFFFAFHAGAKELMPASRTKLLNCGLHDKKASPECTVKFKSSLTNTLRNDQSIEGAMFLQVKPRLIN